MIPTGSPLASHNCRCIPPSDLLLRDAALDKVQWPLPTKSIQLIGNWIDGIAYVATYVKTFILSNCAPESVASYFNDGTKTARVRIYSTDLHRKRQS